jgi:hypothetical protein
VGGVSLLKRHPFFDGLDWVRLAARQLPPPIDVAEAAEAEGGNFHEGFTGQILSPSLVLDALSNDGGSVRSSSPLPREDDCPAEPDPYHDFGYTEPSFRVPRTKVAEFESNAAARALKDAKKRQHVLKVEEKRLRRAAAEEEERQRQGRQRRDENERNRMGRVQREEQCRRREEQSRSASLYGDQSALFAAQQALLGRHALFLGGIAKKAKNTRKKLRDIGDLERRMEAEGGGSARKLSAEQRDKLGRKQALEDDLAELLDRDCEEEEAFAASMIALLAAPGPAGLAPGMPTAAPPPAPALGPVSPSAGGAAESIEEVMARLNFPLFLPPVLPAPAAPPEGTSSATTVARLANTVSSIELASSPLTPRSEAKSQPWGAAAATVTATITTTTTTTTTATTTATTAAAAAATAAEAAHMAASAPAPAPAPAAAGGARAKAGSADWSVVAPVSKRKGGGKR